MLLIAETTSNILERGILFLQKPFAPEFGDQHTQREIVAFQLARLLFRQVGVRAAGKGLAEIGQERGDLVVRIHASLLHQLFRLPKRWAGIGCHGGEFFGPLTRSCLSLPAIAVALDFFGCCF
ncbi:MAG: hypothetical protein E6K70_06925 [Planctomycetota bacterium]|nr:MAG: hypothetical protein E6K70_06925 [Planctomycetota bacterium]